MPATKTDLLSRTTETTFGSYRIVLSVLAWIKQPSMDDVNVQIFDAAGRCETHYPLTSAKGRLLAVLLPAAAPLFTA